MSSVSADLERAESVNTTAISRRSAVFHREGSAGLDRVLCRAIRLSSGFSGSAGRRVLWTCQPRRDRHHAQDDRSGCAAGAQSGAARMEARWDAYIYTLDPDLLFAEFKQRGASFVKELSFIDDESVGLRGHGRRWIRCWHSFGRVTKLARSRIGSSESEWRFRKESRGARWPWRMRGSCRRRRRRHELSDD